MTRDEIIADLDAIEQHLASRREVWRVLVTPDRRVMKRIYRGSFIDTRRSHVSEHSEGEKTT